MPPVQPEPTSTGDDGLPPLPPVTVVWAFRLMLMVAALTFIGMIVTILNRDALRERVAERGVDPAALDAGITMAIVFAVVFGVAFSLFWAWLADMVRRGRNWARVLAWVLASFGVLGALSALFNPMSAGTVVTLIAGALDVAIIVLLAKYPSGPYFRPRAKTWANG